MVSRRVGPQSRLQTRIPIATVTHCIPGSARDAVLTGPSIPQEQSVGAEEPVVVERLHHGNTGAVQGEVHGRRQDWEEVVNVTHFGRMVCQEALDASDDGAVPAGVGAGSHPVGHGSELATVDRKEPHVVTRFEKQLHVEIDGRVLSTAVNVTIVEHRDSHQSLPYCSQRYP